MKTIKITSLIIIIIAVIIVTYQFYVLVDSFKERNMIEAYSKRAECLAELYKNELILNSVQVDSWINVCSDIVYQLEK